MADTKPAGAETTTSGQPSSDPSPASNGSELSPQTDKSPPAEENASRPLPAPHQQRANSNNNSNGNNNNDKKLAEAQAQVPAQRLRVKPLFKRYIVLFLFCVNSANKAFQWVQIPASTDKVTAFYGVENYVVNTLSVLFMLSFFVLSVPACYAIEIIGLRRAIILSSLGATVGSLIKCFSCHQDGIYLLFLGQTIVSLSEQFIFSIPSRLASVWFPDHEVSSAVALCVFGNQLGVAFGFMVPQLMLNSVEEHAEIGLQLGRIFRGLFVLSLLALVGNYALIDEAPKYAPGEARARQIRLEARRKSETGHQRPGFAASMGSLFKQMAGLLGQRDFCLLALSYGITIGLGYTVSTCLNQMLLPIWPGDDILVGNAGFVIIVAGALCSPLWGRLMDHLKRYLFVYTFLTSATFGSLALLTYVLGVHRSRLGLYVGSFLFGSFQTGLIAAGLELGVELTYPTPELVSSTLLNIMPQLGGTIFIYAASFLCDNYGDLVTNLFYLLVLLVALVMLMNIKERLRRQEAVVARQASIAASLQLAELEKVRAGAGKQSLADLSCAPA